MTREIMARLITLRLEMNEIGGVEHIDRPTWWLRQMASELGIIKSPFEEDVQIADEQTTD